MKTELESINCNLCGKNKTRAITVQNGFNIVECLGCGLVYVKPRPSAESLIRMYDTYHSRDSKDPLSWAHLMRDNFSHTAEVLRDRFPDGGKLLDIGCGYGYFLEIMKNTGWDVKGIEPSESAARLAKGNGLNIKHGTIEESDLPKNSFDAITMFYVLEHLFDPSSALKKTFALLKPGGILILRIPHTTPTVKFLSLLGVKNNLYDAPFHLYDFSPKTISEMLEKTGFSGIRIIPGMPTLPKKTPERITSLLSTNLARILYALTMGRFLLPGVSKTVVAFRQ